jgi:predicted regulator of Ras-like GTPase activity (Roadblock/LC7/MglB family)
VQGVLIINADGIPIRTTLDHETSVQARSTREQRSALQLSPAVRPAWSDACRRAQYAAMVSSLTSKARSVLKELPLPGASYDSAAVRCFSTLAVTHS